MHELERIYRYIDFKSAFRFFCTFKIRMNTPDKLNDIFELPLLYTANDPTQYALDRITAEDTFGVTCYSETPTNLLMWSHYADEHRGIVLGFDPNHDFFKNLGRVKYSDRFGNYDSLTKQAILQKGDPWMYEKEWRQIWINPASIAFEIGEIVEPDCFLINVPSESLKEVIYGAKYHHNKDLTDNELDTLNKKNNPLSEFIKKGDWEKYDTHADILSLYLRTEMANIKRMQSEKMPDRYELLIADC